MAKSAPDGHTLLVTPAPFTIVPSLMQKLPYYPQKDFEPITLINTTPLVVVVHPGVPAKSIKELIALAKARPATQLRFVGERRLQSSCRRALQRDGQREDGARAVKGNAPALTDLIGGHVDVVFNGLTSALPSSNPGSFGRSA